LDKNWVLQTLVLRCCVVKGRHTAFAIAAFLLQVASFFFGCPRKSGLCGPMGPTTVWRLVVCSETFPDSGWTPTKSVIFRPWAAAVLQPPELL